MGMHCIIPPEAPHHKLSQGRFPWYIVTVPWSMARYSQTMSLLLVLRSLRAVHPRFRVTNVSLGQDPDTRRCHSSRERVQAPQLPSRWSSRFGIPEHLCLQISSFLPDPCRSGLFTYQFLWVLPRQGKSRAVPWRNQRQTSQRQFHLCTTHQRGTVVESGPSIRC